MEKIIQIAHQQGIPVLLMGLRLLLIWPLMCPLDVDFYAFSSHKMYGPTGIGILYGKSSWLNTLPPWQGGGEMIDEVKWSGTTYNKIPFNIAHT